MHSEGTLQELKIKATSLGVKFSSDVTKKQLTIKIKNKIMSDNTKKGIISKDQIDAWKKEHKKVHIIKVTVDKDDVAVGYLKPPTRNIKAAALSMYSQNKVLESGEFLRDNCWLGGDDRLKTDGDIADTAAMAASGIFKMLDSELGEA
jgi:hypothetical protein